MRMGHLFIISSKSSRQSHHVESTFPQNNRELTIAAAWRFADEGKRTLVFCTQRDHVESYAKLIVDLARRGFIAPLVKDVSTIERAKSIGSEWLGAHHPAVTCLELGVAIHHGRLPNPFRREIERLLSDDISNNHCCISDACEGSQSQCCGLAGAELIPGWDHVNRRRVRKRCRSCWPCIY